MISETGKDLNIVILTKTAGDWQAFSTWYSIWKNLPDARVSILCIRNMEPAFQFFQWAKRMNVQTYFTNTCELNDRISEIFHALSTVKCSSKTLLIPDDVMVVDILDQKTVDLINQDNYELMLSDKVVVSNMSKERLVALAQDHVLLGTNDCVLVEENLTKEAKDTNISSSIVSYSKGCGRWIDSMEGCPFSSAGGLLADDMTVNEVRIIELWRKMVSLYSAIQ